MSNRYSLEEQEEIAKLKAFWASYGNFILTVLILVLGGFAGRNGYEWYKSTQSADAVSAFERVQEAVASKDMELLKKVAVTLTDDFGSTTYAERGAVLAARAFYDAGDLDSAAVNLQWVVTNGELAEYQATARLALSSLYIEQNKLDQALALVDGVTLPGFEGLLNDRAGDVLLAKGDPVKAREYYENALEQLQAESPWRSVVQRKIASLPAGS